MDSLMPCAPQAPQCPAAQIAIPASASASSTATVTAMPLSAARPATRLCSAASSGRVTAPLTRAAPCAFMSSAGSRKKSVSMRTPNSLLQPYELDASDMLPSCCLTLVAKDPTARRTTKQLCGWVDRLLRRRLHGAAHLTLCPVLCGAVLTAQQLLQLSRKVVLRLLHRALEGVGAQAALERRRRRPRPVAGPLPPRRHTCC